MSTHLHITVGQCSDKGQKPLNQDFHAVLTPKEPLLSTKGIAVVLADGISSSEVSQIASKTSVTGFINDYFSTPETWSVKSSAVRVLQATNSWLYSQTRNGPYRYNMNKGYVCTFSALVFKSTTAHIIHAGDTRVYRVSDKHLEQLTEDHRMWVSREKSYLSRALGMRDWLEVDYQSVDIEVGDTFILATDGVYEFADEQFIAETIKQHEDDLDTAAKLIIEHALENDSDDNLSIQIARVDQLPTHAMGELQQQASELPFPPELHPRMEFDGYEIVREVQRSYRSHVFLAQDKDTHKQVIVKLPSTDLRDDSAYIERFLMEEWIARRINNVHVVKAGDQTRKRNYLYTVSEFIDGQTLSQWMIDNPNPDLETVRKIVEQIAKGLYALHRQEMLHQDLRPNNIMIDKAGTIKLIDFGSVSVAGVVEMTGLTEQQHILGTAQYSAPEYFLGEVGTTRSDLFSLGVITYQMLSGKLPYGPHIARATSKAAQQRLTYQTVLDDERTIPAWIDETIQKAVHPNPHKRYDEISEFIHDLRNPSQAFLRKDRAPLLDRNPILFWKVLSLLLFIATVLLLSTHPMLNS